MALPGIPNYIELSLAKADRKISNADYHVTLSQPIQIEEGDQVSLHLATIDSQQADSQSIVLNEDTLVSISYVYYDVDYEAGDKFQYTVPQGITPWPMPTYAYFVSYTARDVYQLEYAVAFCWDYEQRENPLFTVEVNVSVTFEWVDQDGAVQRTTWTGSTSNYTPPQVAPYIQISNFLDTGTPIVYLEGTLQIGRAHV